MTLKFSGNSNNFCVRVASKGNLTCLLIVTGVDLLTEDLARNIEFDFTLHNSLALVRAALLDLYYTTPQSAWCKCVQIPQLSTPGSGL